MSELRRLEDLGRIRERLHMILHEDIFYEKLDDHLAIKIDNLRELIWETWDIACGENEGL